MSALYPQEQDVKPPRFDYHAPHSLGDAIELLSRYAGDARVLAGGQSLIPMLNFRLAQPTGLIDLRLIDELAGIEFDKGVVSIGAMTRQRRAEHSPIVKQKLPLMADALRWVGHVPTRTRGTIGGSIAHADPSAELPMVLLALNGAVVAAGSNGTRRIEAAELFHSIFTTTLAPDEILTQVLVPEMPYGCAFAFEEFARRPGDFALAAVAVVSEPCPDKSLRVRIVVGGVGERVYRAHAAEQMLGAEGLATREAQDVVARVAKLASEAAEPMGDPGVSADYRRQLVRVLTERALKRVADGSPTLR